MKLNAATKKTDKQKKTCQWACCSFFLFSFLRFLKLEMEPQALCRPFKCSAIDLQPQHIFWLEGGFCWFLFFNYFTFMCIFCLHVYKCTMHMARAFVDWNRMLALLELDLEVVVSHHVDMGLNLDLL